ncbi:MAG: carbamoyl-phosphate synthase (glutamine-hydrolyzing) large subunit [Thermoplasmata archaeon]|nr:carbamoyl-phosphate synthase (glutamine-hydrolyzing) large subunit [Thermoplasmata archaeon]
MGRSTNGRKKVDVRRVLLIGSGAIKIGEAGEFDYSGSQALKALKEEGIYTVLVNPNIATIQTSEEFADKIYFIPLRVDFIEKVIRKEKIDGILLGFGGQTALNCGVELYKAGILKRYGVKVLGTPIKTIIETEDRKLFTEKLKKAGFPVPKSKTVSSIKEGEKAAEELGYPVMIRLGYALGGLGSGIAETKEELKEILSRGFAYTDKIQIEECLYGWKEVEYEVVRDCEDNCITVCNMENIDPLGIHTGESIVVAPSQTLTNIEYHLLRDVAIMIIRLFGIIGECNIQFALDPRSSEYRVIEVNSRLSRSSALASKATGYPLAAIAAKLSLGYTLKELRNAISNKTVVFFEPALDYVVVKIPRWDLKKFREVSKEIGSGMKSVGEVMAIGRTFGEALQKAIRMLSIGMHGLVANRIRFENLEKELRKPSDLRIFAIVEAIKRGFSTEKLSRITRIDPWFIEEIKNIVELAKEIEKYTIDTLPSSLLFKSKCLGFSDFQLARLLHYPGKLDDGVLAVRARRKKEGIIPVVKQIDTLAAEYPASTNYLYMTYNGVENDVKPSSKGIIVLGGGPYRIGSSVEFDWCCVHAVLTARRKGYHTILINNNPETVSTDYDICDRLYFDELSFERVTDICEFERGDGVIVSMGGQIPNNLALRLHRYGIKILGTHPSMIDVAEDRHKFSSLLDKLGIKQPEWKELQTVENAIEFAEKVGYPVLVRPSYVLSGSAMNVAFDSDSLKKYLENASNVSKDHPVVISKFILNAKEIDFDAVAKNGKILIFGISEHVENAGVHSGDATLVLPPQRMYIETLRRIKNIADKLASNLKITGPFNIQFMAKDNNVYVIECNLRASRSFPFVSKVMKTNFIELATCAILNTELPPIKRALLDLEYVGVKSPHFSFNRLSGADPVLGVEMASTGEVACIGENLYEAFLKSIIAAGYHLPEKGVLISIGGEKQRYRFLAEAKILKQKDFKIYATEHTSEFFNKHNIPNLMLLKAHNIHKKNNVLSYMEKGLIDLVIAVPDPEKPNFSKDHYILRRKAVDLSIPLVTNLQLAKLFVQAINNVKLNNLKVKSWDEY